VVDYLTRPSRIERKYISSLCRFDKIDLHPVTVFIVSRQWILENNGHCILLKCVYLYTAGHPFIITRTNTVRYYYYFRIQVLDFFRLYRNINTKTTSHTFLYEPLHGLIRMKDKPIQLSIVERKSFVFQI